jgi:hypothetical protein
MKNKLDLDKNFKRCFEDAERIVERELLGWRPPVRKNKAPFNLEAVVLDILAENEITTNVAKSDQEPLGPECILLRQAISRTGAYSLVYIKILNLWNAYYSKGSKQPGTSHTKRTAA